jgi:alpha-tubulin suppressor-like RCC1 family protein
MSSIRQPKTPKGGWKQVAAGTSHIVALKGNGTVACWGRNHHGSCKVPTRLGPVIAVAAGDFHTVALKASGSVTCWGYNGDGQCNVPAGLANIIAVAAGDTYTLALKADGTVTCWGTMHQAEDFKIPWELSDDGWLDFLADYRHSLMKARLLTAVVPARIRRHPEYRGICAMQRI